MCRVNGTFFAIQVFYFASSFTIQTNFIQSMIKIRYALLFIAVVLFAACTKFDNITTDEWQPDVALTLFNTSINTVDLFEDYGQAGELLIDTDQQLTFVYRSNGYSVESKDVLTLIPDVSFPMIDTFMKLPYPLPADITIDYIVAKSGEIKFTTGNPYTEPVEFTFTIPESKLNGVPFSKTVTIGAANDVLPIFPSIASYPLADYILTPQSDSMIFQYSARLVNSGSMVTLPAVIVDFIDPVYVYAQGFLGSGSFPIPLDSVEVDFFELFSDGSVFFEEPTMTISTRNSFGFPVRAYFNILNAINIDGTSIPFGSDELSAGVDFNYPSINEVGEEAETVFVIDKDNSNIANIIGQPVAYFEYEVEVISNPDGDTSITSFVTDTSSFYLDAEVELPLYGKVDGFTVNDTLDFELTGEYDEVNDVEFKLVTENEFPLDVELQVLFTDNEYNVIDELLTASERILTSAPVDTNGEAIDSSRKETFIPFPKDRFNNVKEKATRILVQARVTSANDGNTSVRIREHHEVDIKLGVIAGVNP